MTILFNGSEFELATDATLKTFLEERGLAARKLLLEYNGEMLPVQWEDFPLHPGDRVEAFQLVAGG